MNRHPMRPEDLEAMDRHAEEEFPSECCGVVIGKLGDPSQNEVRPCKNIQEQMRASDPEAFSRGADTGYFMDPKCLHKAMMDAAKKGLELIGFYHSHPDHGAYWSDEDNRAAMWADEPSYPDAFHVVISVLKGRVAGRAVFVWDNASRLFTQVKQ